MALSEWAVFQLHNLLGACNDHKLMKKMVTSIQKRKINSMLRMVNLKFCKHSFSGSLLIRWSSLECALEIKQRITYVNLFCTFTSDVKV